MKGELSMKISFWKEKGSKYAVVVLVGLLILILCVPSGTSLQVKESEVVSVSSDELEVQLARVLSAMEGVGEVEVMISMESMTTSKFDTGGEGEKVRGVVVVAEGAGNATVNKKISEAVKALFSIDVHKISIVKMRSREDRK